MYRLLRPILFAFTPETAHKIIASFLKILYYIPLSGPFLRLFYSYKSPQLEREVMGIKFKNPIGLAAGLDKNGEIYNGLSNFGFGFIEIGSVTPQAQPGNALPRCFRLIPDKALINRFGINNKGVKKVVQNLQKRPPQVLIGGNISKNTLTLNEKAGYDYEKTFARLYDYVDYFVINVSCPNVKDLCKLNDITFLSDIIDRLTELRRYYDTYRPILLKVSPDLSFEELDELIELIMVSGLDGVVATNTTISRNGLITSAEQLEAIGNGGLSGAPLKKRSLEMVRYIHKKTDGHLPIIGVGGVMTPQDAVDMLQAGASLVQIYSGFIYSGPGLVRSILKKVAKLKL